MTESWNVRGVHLQLPRPDEIELFEEFTEKILVPGKCNLLIMEVNYGYQFTSHPECTSPDEPLSSEHIKIIVDICKKHNIRLIPLMQLLGHQSAPSKSFTTALKPRLTRSNGLLLGHPEFDETPGQNVVYCRNLCPTHPEIKPIVFDLMDEIIDVFEADAIHVGCDEAILIGECDRCKKIPKDQLFADWVNALARHAKSSRNAQTLIWGDHLLNALDIGYVEVTDEFNAYVSGTENAINLLDKDIIICDWQYDYMENGYPSIDRFADAGFQVLAAVWHKNNGKKFLQYAKEHNRGHVQGFLQTVWSEFGQVAEYALRGLDGNFPEYSPVSGVISLPDLYRVGRVAMVVDSMNWILKEEF